MVNDKAARTYHTVEARPMPESAMDKFHMEIEKSDWENVISAQSAHEKAAIFQAEHVNIVEKCFPKKLIKLSSDD